MLRVKGDCTIEGEGRKKLNLFTISAVFTVLVNENACTCTVASEAVYSVKELKRKNTVLAIIMGVNLFGEGAIYKIGQKKIHSFSYFPALALVTNNHFSKIEATREIRAACKNVYNSANPPEFWTFLSEKKVNVPTPPKCRHASSKKVMNLVQSQEVLQPATEVSEHFGVSKKTVKQTKIK